MTAFYSAGQLWHESRVSWTLKRHGDLSSQEGDGRGEKERSWAGPHNVQQGGTAFLEIGTL